MRKSAISKAYVEMLGGKIRVENNAERDSNASGSTFLFTIPASPLEQRKSFAEAM